jgi:hypothetical protein
MSDIVQRLRKDAPPFGLEHYDPTYDTRCEAADEIERLRNAVEAAWNDAIIAASDRISIAHNECCDPSRYDRGECCGHFIPVQAAIRELMKDRTPPKRRRLGHDADGTPLNIIEPHCGQCVIDPRDGETWCVCGKQPGEAKP